MTFANSKTKCSCKLNLPIIKNIEGRKLDFLYKADGAKINSVNIANGFKNIPNAIIKAQVLQKKIGTIYIKLEIDKNLFKPHYDKILRNEFIHRFGTSTKIIIEHVNEIPREKSGKFALIKNLVPTIE